MKTLFEKKTVNPKSLKQMAKEESGFAMTNFHAIHYAFMILGLHFFLYFINFGKVGKGN